jgi:hypothetical protein
MNFTAKQIAAGLGMKRQAVQWHLRDVPPASTPAIVNGNEAAAWAISQLPEALRNRAAREARRQNCRGATDEARIHVLFSMPRRQWPPPLALNKICDADIAAANKLREALLPWLMRQHDPALASAEMEARGVEDYRRVCGNGITARYWRELFTRTILRDNGFEEWNRLEIYLPECPKAKAQPASVVSEALAADFADLENFIAGCGNPHDPTKDERAGLWKLALVKFDELVRAGQPEKTAARRVREFLWAQARFLARSRDALRKAFELRLAKGIEDGRKANGDRAEYPSQDIRRVRHSAVLKNGSRIDAAWREEYPRLSEYTRQRHPNSRRCPHAFYQLVNRERVNALKARLAGKRVLRRMIGGVTRNAENIPSMARWAVDDLTANLECYFKNTDGTVSLIQPQVIAVMDFASRKFVGWSVDNVKAPNTKLVNAAILDGFKRHGVPRQLWIENGFVFGKSLDINGKEDERGRTVVAGLAQYGCTIHHFDKMSPTSKGELEKSFDLLQRLMERHPGYTGRMQMFDASEDFKREQRLIRSGKVPASDFRYSYDEFVRVLNRLFEAFNASPQHGHLRGLSPNEAFEILQDRSNPAIAYDNRLHWYFASTRDLVLVKAGGVMLPRRGIQVRGGDLPQHIGEELWALVDREDDTMVTFMSQDYRQTFTVETCRQPSADASSIATGGSVLAAELAKIGKHALAVNDEYKSLQGEFGNPRRDLLAQIRADSPALANVPNDGTRRVILNSRLEKAGGDITAQRAAIKAQRKQATVTKARADRQGIPSALVRNDARSLRAIELSEEARRDAGRLESMEPTEHETH